MDYENTKITQHALSNVSLQNFGNWTPYRRRGRMMRMRMRMKKTQIKTYFPFLAAFITCSMSLSWTRYSSIRSPTFTDKRMSITCQSETACIKPQCDTVNSCMMKHHVFKHSATSCIHEQHRVFNHSNIMHSHTVSHYAHLCELK